MSSETSAEVQKEAEAERAELVSTLDRLRDNLKPGNVVDEVMASAKLSTAELSDRVWKTAAKHPIPMVIIGIGAAMLLGAGKKVRSSMTSSSHDWHDDEDFSDLEDRINSPYSPGDVPRSKLAKNSDRLSSAGASQIRAVDSKMSAVADRVSGPLRSLAGRATNTARDHAAEAPKAFSGDDTMSQYSRSRDQVAGTLSRLLEDQPLVLAAIGVAVGAALGAAIPSTDAESRLMGDASETFRNRAQELAQSEYRHIKETASNAVGEMKQAAIERGASTDNLSGLVQDASAKVRDAANEVAGHVADSAGLKS